MATNATASKQESIALGKEFLDCILTSQTRHERNLKSLLTNLDSIGWEAGLTRESYAGISAIGFRGDNAVLAAVAAEVSMDCKPITLRGLFYRCVSAGVLPSTADLHYKRLGRLVTTLRRKGLVSYSWIVDNLRSTLKPSSWSGLQDFAEVARNAYRKDFWNHLETYVHIFCEKDAIAGVIQPVTQKYDVRLSPVRGYCSESFAHEIGASWKDITKPIHAYYVGDYDPSGFDIERDLEAKLREHAGNSADITWSRLALHESDFDEFNLIELAVKKTDNRYKKFIQKHGDRCAEVDALEPQEIRRRVDDAINQHIPQDEWNRLLHIEEIEQESVKQALSNLGSLSDSE